MILVSDEEIKKLKEKIHKLQISDAEKEKRIKRLEEIVDVQQYIVLYISKKMTHVDKPGEN